MTHEEQGGSPCLIPFHPSVICMLRGTLGMQWKVREVDQEYVEKQVLPLLPNRLLSHRDGSVWVVSRTAVEVKPKVDVRCYRFEGRYVKVEIGGDMFDRLSFLVHTLIRLDVVGDEFYWLQVMQSTYETVYFMGRRDRGDE